LPEEVTLTGAPVFERPSVFDQGTGSKATSVVTVFQGSRV
jgi:hypothetical protein